MRRSVVGCLDAGPLLVGHRAVRLHAVLQSVAVLLLRLQTVDLTLIRSPAGNPLIDAVVLMALAWINHRGVAYAYTNQAERNAASATNTSHVFMKASASVGTPDVPSWNAQESTRRASPHAWRPRLEILPRKAATQGGAHRLREERHGFEAGPHLAPHDSPRNWRDCRGRITMTPITRLLHRRFPSWQATPWPYESSGGTRVSPFHPRHWPP